MLQKLIKNILCILIISVVSITTTVNATEIIDEPEHEISETTQDDISINDNEEELPESEQENESKDKPEEQPKDVPEEILTGWQEIEGETYYFQPETGEMFIGRQQIETKFYYFDEDGIL